MSPSAFDDDDGDAIIEMSILPPRWADISDEVADMLADIALQSSKLDKLHQKHVLPGFDDDAEKKKEEREIEQLTQGVTRGFHECQRAISGIDNMVKEAQRDGTISAAEEKMAQNIKINLASRVQEASAGFRKKQSAYLKSNITSAPKPKYKMLTGYHRTTRHVRPRQPRTNRHTNHLVLKSIPLRHFVARNSIRRILLLSRFTNTIPRLNPRSTDSTTRTRNRGHRERNSGPGRNIQGVTNYGNRSRNNVGSD